MKSAQTKKKAPDKKPHRQGFRGLIPHARIEWRIAEIAKAIRKDFPDEPLHLIGVLKGAVFFLADLARELSGEVSFDFIAVSSYGNSINSSGQVKLTRDLDSSIEGKVVIVVEDILDTGTTLEYLLRVLRQRKPKQLRVAVLLDKSARRMVAVQTDYVGFRIPDVFVVGYGLDHGERYRNFRDIGVLPAHATGDEIFGFMEGKFKISGDIVSPVLPAKEWKRLK